MAGALVRSFLSNRRENSSGHYGDEEENDIRIDEITSEIRRIWSAEKGKHEPWESTDTSIQNDDQDARLAFNEAIGKLDDSTSCIKSCGNCSKPKRVLDVRQFKRGQHISMPGKLATKYDKKTRNLKNAYNHHAIIQEVKRAAGTAVKLVLIHFTQDEENDGSIIVKKEELEYDICEVELYIVEYVHPKYDTEKVVARAEKVLSSKGTFEGYNILSRNCEHFATWCVVGKGTSFQVNNLAQTIANGISLIPNIGSKIAKVVLRIAYMSADEIASGLKLASPNIVLGITAGLYLIYCIFMTVKIMHNFKSDRLCRACRNGKLQDLWLTFGAFGATSILTSVIFHFAIPSLSGGAGLPVAILLVLLSIGLQIAVPKIRKALSSPFTVNQYKVTSLTKLSRGDIISIHHTLYEHSAVVSRVEEKAGRIRVIHYGRPTRHGREIVEEYINFGSQKTKIYLLDCKSLDTFPKDEVVSRARSRIGETKWRLSNRSHDFAYWAKIKRYEDGEFDNSGNEDEQQQQNDTLRVTINEEFSEPAFSPKVSLFVEEREIHRMGELRIGDVVKGKDVGILSSIRNLDSNDRLFEIDIITKRKLGEICHKIQTINLSTDRLYVKVYHKALCIEMEQRARNARAIIGEKMKWWTTDGFIRHCIESK